MRTSDQRGVMLMHAIVVMGLVTVVVAVIAGALGARAAAVRSEALSLQAFYAAESGVAATLAAVRAGESPTAVRRGTVGACSFVARVGRVDGGPLEIRSSGRCGDRERTVIRRPDGG